MKRRNLKQFEAALRLMTRAQLTQEYTRKRLKALTEMRNDEGIVVDAAYFQFWDEFRVLEAWRQHIEAVEQAKAAESEPAARRCTGSSYT